MKIEKVIGHPQPDAVLRLLESGQDPCFGLKFSKDAPDKCGDCLLPLVVDGRVRACRSVCQELTENRTPQELLPSVLSAREISSRILSGQSVQDVLDEIAGPNAGEAHVKAARTLLSRRLASLRRQGVDVPTLTQGLKDS